MVHGCFNGKMITISAGGGDRSPVQGRQIQTEGGEEGERAVLGGPLQRPRLRHQDRPGRGHAQHRSQAQSHPGGQFKARQRAQEEPKFGGLQEETGTYLGFYLFRSLRLFVRMLLSCVRTTAMLTIVQDFCMEVLYLNGPMMISIIH